MLLVGFVSGHYYYFCLLPWERLWRFLWNFVPDFLVKIAGQSYQISITLKFWILSEKTVLVTILFFWQKYWLNFWFLTMITIFGHQFVFDQNFSWIFYQIQFLTKVCKVCFCPNLFLFLTAISFFCPKLRDKKFRFLTKILG